MTLMIDYEVDAPQLLEFESDFERLKFEGRSAANVYAELGIDRNDLFEHAERAESLVRAYAGNDMPEEAIQMALVHDVFDRFWNTTSTKSTFDRRESAKYILLDMFTEKYFAANQVDYALGILHDMVKVEQESGKHRSEMAKEARKDKGQKTISTEVINMLTDKYEGDIPKNVWETIEPYIDFEHMDNFLHDTNIESLVIKACELVDNMRHPSSTRESAILQDVLEAESFYAPILEVIGYDGLASSLRSEAHCIRLMKQDKSEVLKTATEELEKIEHLGIDSIANEVFGDWRVNGCINAVGIDSLTDKVPVTVGDCMIKTKNSNNIDVKYRIKTVGSLADKMERYGKEMPKDIVGFTVISNNEEDSARDFADFIIDRMPEMTETIAKNKQKAFFVQGSEEYIGMIRQILEEKLKNQLSDGRKLEDLVEFKAQSPGQLEEAGHRKLNVAKVTMQTKQGVFVETQFLTKKEREAARTGEVAHIIFKYFRQLEKIGKDVSAQEKRAIVEQATKVLGSVHNRRLFMNRHNLQVNERSIRGAEAVAFALAT